MDNKLIYFNDYFKVEDDSYIDIPLNSDVQLYVDPNRIQLINDPFFDSESAMTKINHYFSIIFYFYRNKQKNLAVDLLDIPKEINAVHFGLSKGKSQGTGPSREILHRFFEQVTNELEHSLLSHPVLIPLFVRNFGPDRFSDLIVNIISKELAEYTHRVSVKHSIQTCEVALCDYFDTQDSTWKTLRASLPTGPDGEPILIVPQNLATDLYGFSAERYVTHILLVFLQDKHYREGSRLVRYEEKDGVLTMLPPHKKTVRKEEILIPYAEVKGKIKTFALEQSIAYPHLLEQYVNFVEGRTFILNNYKK